ncbi:hypothetical protein PB2503_03372 [Parvularcula bermudensis HTCC2503]|uniref:DUF4112 domain-containing protein n=1 Tax=Parvularcula bermudensis (strain ATCC BAA-594 / HTCC2503 / KCTC 12087) TaxID=314260 RepID=E0TDJ5_PARBH|nr:DUF4112 domain-containing protein [Parvularcula bermudensis]ADM08750.1 hypothetical protein PB2503_03372 [Parvularcula bermudensis HTCC2503]
MTTMAERNSPTIDPSPEPRGPESLGHATQVRRLRRLSKLARLLDARFGVPGFRFGLDGIIGLVPGVGDAIMAAISIGIVVEAARMGARTTTLIRMVFNIVIDSLAGAVPLLGDIFDIFYKANLRNIDLLRREFPDAAAEVDSVAKDR